MHWLQQKSSKALKLFGLNEFMATDNIPHPGTLKTLQQNVKLEYLQNIVWSKLKWTPTDLMHAYHHSILVYIIKILFAPLNNQEKSALDAVCFIWFLT